jgi:hypothetical protein
MSGQRLNAKEYVDRVIHYIYIHVHLNLKTRRLEVESGLYSVCFVDIDDYCLLTSSVVARNLY